MASPRHGKRPFGSIRKLPSGRFQARYTGPDGQAYTARSPQGRSLTFQTRGDADGWLSLRQSEIVRDAWLPPAAPKAAPTTLAAYARVWMAGRELKPTTRQHYDQVLRDHVLPKLGAVPVASITPSAVREWHAAMLASVKPTARAHAYSLLRTMLNTAVADELIAANPCRVRGAGSVRRAKEPRPATLPQLEALTKAMPERYRLLVLLAAWCGLRFGELSELRRSDVDVTNGVIRVHRGITRTKGQRHVADPKSAAGRRSVNIPPHVLPAVQAHLSGLVGGALLFPSATDPAVQVCPSTLQIDFYRARKAAGRPDLRVHDLRHTGAVLAAATGATLAELMARLGHSTPGAAMRYQHAAADRDKVIAAALSKLAAGDVTPMRRPRKAAAAAVARKAAGR